MHGLQMFNAQFVTYKNILCGTGKISVASKLSLAYIRGAGSLQSI